MGYIRSCILLPFRLLASIIYFLASIINFFCCHSGDNDNKPDNTTTPSHNVPGASATRVYQLSNSEMEMSIAPGASATHDYQFSNSEMEMNMIPSAPNPNLLDEDETPAPIPSIGFNYPYLGYNPAYIPNLPGPQPGPVPTISQSVSMQQQQQQQQEQQPSPYQLINQDPAGAVLAVSNSNLVEITSHVTALRLEVEELKIDSSNTTHRAAFNDLWNRLQDEHIKCAVVECTNDKEIVLQENIQMQLNLSLCLLEEKVNLFRKQEFNIARHALLEEVMLLTQKMEAGGAGNLNLVEDALNILKTKLISLSASTDDFNEITNNSDDLSLVTGLIESLEKEFIRRKQNK